MNLIFKFIFAVVVSPNLLLFAISSEMRRIRVRVLVRFEFCLQIFVIWFCGRTFHRRLCVIMIPMTVNYIISALVKFVLYQLYPSNPWLHCCELYIISIVLSGFFEEFNLKKNKNKKPFDELFMRTLCKFEII